MTDNLINKNPFSASDYKFRSFDGAGKNFNNFQLGSAGSTIIHLTPLDYDNGFSTPSGQNCLNPLPISNAIAGQIKIYLWIPKS